MSEKLVAVAMSVYFKDIPSQVKISIESILNQTFKSTTLYIMIDGCVDKELQELIDSYSDDSRIVIVKSSENRGLAASLNHLIDLILAENKFNYIARMDSDDISLNERLSTQVDFLECRSDVDVVGGYCHEFGANFALDVKTVPLEHEALVHYTLFKCPFIHPTVMFRTDVFQAGIRYPLDTCMSEDLALWFLLLLDGYKFANIEKVILNYRINAETLKRRSGIRKAISEVKIRLTYSHLLKQKSLKVFILILARGVFSLMPYPIKKIMYLKCR